MDDTITVNGNIHFEPENVTKKHENQASWKKVALAIIDGGDICEYYSWFIKRRYRVILNKPLRNSHVTFINDSERDLGEYGLNKWKEVKQKYDGKPIDITLFVSPRSNAIHWYLNIPEEHRTELHNIRAELGLGRPYFGLHMSLGYVNDLNKPHSEYILRLIENGLIE